MVKDVLKQNRDVESLKDIYEILMNNIQYDDIKKFKLIFEYDENSKTNIDINKLNEYGDYPLIFVTAKNNLEIAKLIIGYVNINNITLKLNENS
ncbi:hypothetical protein H8356DRAFT_1345349 [Neocallimastix lanati (nom. inval.)]|nr:hypothetical protein H8356DRAFT_1345349 [Neocallimastix sp. JGI-2020a]